MPSYDVVWQIPLVAGLIALAYRFVRAPFVVRDYEMSENESAEQQARDMLERAGVEDAQSFTAGDLVEIANLIRQRDRLRALSDDKVTHFARFEVIDHTSDKRLTGGRVLSIEPVTVQLIYQDEGRTLKVFLT